MSTCALFPLWGERNFTIIHRSLPLTALLLLLPVITVQAQEQASTEETADLDIPAPVKTAAFPAKAAPVDLTAQPDPIFLTAGDKQPMQSNKRAKPPVASEIIAEGLVSYGNYQIFAAGTDCKLFTSGVEYDRHSWGRFLGSRFDYVAEVLPFVLLDEPALSDMWGNPKSTNKKLVPGIGFSPIGFRWMWRDKRAIRPYLEVKGGGLIFSQKALSTASTYENFSFQSAMGVQVMMTDRVGLRLGLFSDFHFSNAFIKDSNPGLDVMNGNLGVSWHFNDP